MSRYYLMAESGSTKTDWVVFSSTEVRETIRTSGINPVVMTDARIVEGPLAELALREEDAPVALYFYGAGLGSVQARARVQRLLEQRFPGTEVHVWHDMLGAARAVCGALPGIVCILGTGSNSCLYDGSAITASLGGHGYLFGDEGGGQDLGRHFLRAALEGDLPQHVVQALLADRGASLMELRDQAYAAPQPNAFLATLSPFIAANLSEPAVAALVEERMYLFLERTVMRYEGQAGLPVHFIGSVAQIYAQPLAAAMRRAGLEQGRTIGQPGTDLVAYHQHLLAARGG